MDLLSTLEHVLLAFLAHSQDIMADLQDVIRTTMLQDLIELETNGITFIYRGQEVTMKVILLCVCGDNLGIHQMGGLRIAFSGNTPCRLCFVTARSLKELFQLIPEEQKTMEKYDDAIANGTAEEQIQFGIQTPCCFNELEYFHIYKGMSVDFMHDQPEGHLQRLIPLVIRDAIRQGHTLETINSAIIDFGYIGPDKENVPRPIYLTNPMPPGGDVISKYTANNMVTLVKLLPLIFKFAGIHLRSDVWSLFLQFQRILDILWAPEIDEPTVQLLERLVQNYLEEYQALDGYMTLKPHLLLHYPDIIRQMGPLKYNASFRFEAKHRTFKQYAKVNRCHKLLPKTLAEKHAMLFAQTLNEMNKGMLMFQKNYVVYTIFRKLYSNLAGIPQPRKIQAWISCYLEPK